MCADTWSIAKRRKGRYTKHNAKFSPKSVKFSPYKSQSVNIPLSKLNQVPHSYLHFKEVNPGASIGEYMELIGPERSRILYERFLVLNALNRDDYSTVISGTRLRSGRLFSFHAANKTYITKVKAPYTLEDTIYHAAERSGRLGIDSTQVCISWLLKSKTRLRAQDLYRLLDVGVSSEIRFALKKCVFFPMKKEDSAETRRSREAHYFPVDRIYIMYNLSSFYDYVIYKIQNGAKSIDI